MSEDQELPDQGASDAQSSNPASSGQESSNQESSDPEGQELPYRETSDPEWNRVAAGTAAVSLHPDERTPEVIVVSGPCPRCGHPSVFSERLVAYSSAIMSGGGLRRGLLSRALYRATAQQGARQVEVICGCRTDHDETGERKGCGASWVLHVEWGV
ncbi:hypothetical protein ACFYYR_00460 [Streptomyces sp. NPDC001922]|uniref:hypothetical protein n=1 Tax=Streptomyces sp. NPDC001922 TaxID=3364624 RepID=UPI003673B0B2